MSNRPEIGERRWKQDISTGEAPEKLLALNLARVAAAKK
jgi:hypothetical protein